MSVSTSRASIDRFLWGYLLSAQLTVVILGVLVVIADYSPEFAAGGDINVRNLRWVILVLGITLFADALLLYQRVTKGCKCCNRSPCGNSGQIELDNYDVASDDTTD